MTECQVDGTQSECYSSPKEGRHFAGLVWILNLPMKDKSLHKQRRAVRLFILGRRNGVEKGLEMGKHKICKREKPFLL